MSAIAPQTELRLIKCPIEADNRHQIDFANATAQYNYFNSLPHLTVDNFTYQRESSVIRYPGIIDNIRQYNYVMYQNEAFSNKWFYAFITNMSFVSGSMTSIEIQTDSFQTWQFDLQYKKSFVEREHVTDDTVGKHTIPENLELGEYTQYNVKTGYSGLGSCHVVMGSTANPITGFGVKGGVYGEIFSGVSYYLFYGTTDCAVAIDNLTSLGKAEAITMLFMAPDQLTEYNSANWITAQTSSGTVQYCEISQFEVSLPEFNVVKPSRFNDSFTPKNNKLLTYPYQYFVLSNNCGESGIYKYEDFNSELCSFKVYGTITPGCSIRAIPYMYKNQTGEGLSSDTMVWQEGISCGKYPQCNWNTDGYTNWLVQNGTNNFLSQVSGVINSGTSLLGGLIGGRKSEGSVLSAGSGAIGGFMNVLSAMNQEHVAMLLPRTFEGNTNNGDITYAKNRMKFESYPIQIRPEYARIIDDYFTMYGYKVNELKIPQLKTRSKWNFIKTIDCNIEGDVPQKDIQAIKNMFNEGVTLWHDTNHYLDYSQNNTIL